MGKNLKMSKEKVVLAYSGGLDTSVILKWLVENGYDVIAYTCNIGQIDFDEVKIKERALNIGASKFYSVDAREEFLTSYVFKALMANAKYEGRYLLGTALARPLIAKKQIEIARKEGAKILSHGATGKGNDQIRFELAYLTLAPEMKIYAPWKDKKFLEKFKGRNDLIEYAKQNNIPIKHTKKEPWSTDENLMHISYEGGMLENPMQEPLEKMFQLTVSPKNAPDKETIIEIVFEKGIPVEVRNLSDGTIKKGALDLFYYLNEIGGKNGIGRLDMVESRYIGMKSRGVYESPAATILHIAHVDLEGITMDKEVMKIRDMLVPLYAEKIYCGYWFSPEMKILEKFFESTQEYVSGVVRISLYKGNVNVIGRQSDFSLYDEKLVSMHEEGKYEPEKVRGFIDINALRLQINYRREIAKKEKI